MMDGKKLLMVGILIGAIVLVIGIFVMYNPISYDAHYSTNNDASYCGDPMYYTFNNSTSEATAISVARLNEGMMGFGSNVLYNSGYAPYIKINASLSYNKKYWIVNMSMGEPFEWIVTVDPKTWMSKKNGESLEGTNNTWRSLDELKAKYIAELKTATHKDLYIGKPSKITLDGKEIWKVPVYKSNSQGMNATYNEEEIIGYVYVDLITGKSKTFLGTVGWSTLEEVDEALTRMGSPYSPPFKDALRDLYQE